MRTLWPTRPLSEICDIRIGKTPTRSEPRFWGGDHPWLSIKDMNQGRELRETAENITDEAVQEQKCRLVKPGTLLLSFKLSIGKVGIAQQPMYTNEAIAQLPILAPDVDRDYLYWALRTVPLTGEVDRAAMGATLNKAKLKRIPIPVPPVDEQRRIAAVLDAADELRAKRRHGLQLVRDLENAMFADFVESHASGETARLGEVAERVTVGHVGPTSEYFADDGIAFIRTGNIGDGTILRRDLRYVTPAFHATLAKSTLRAGDLLISRVISDEVRAAVVPPDFDGANCANAIIVRPGQRTSATFLLGLLRLARSQTALLGRRVGSAQSVVNTKVVKEWHVPVPSRAALEDLDHSYRRLRSIEALHLASLESLTALFTSLQQRAFRGEL
jgi:type I restriction enzyme, S subunit